MTVERSWRIDRDSPTSPGTYGVVQFEEGQPYEHVGVLIPDTRLQAIADTWSNYLHERDTDSDSWVSWPQMADLLDALTKEKDDDS